MISFIISCKLHYKTLLLSCLKILVLVFFFQILGLLQNQVNEYNVFAVLKKTPMQSENNHFVFETVGNKSQIHSQHLSAIHITDGLVKFSELTTYSQRGEAL